MNRGSESRPQGTPQLATGFNEAPIHESGKFDRDGRDGSVSRASMRPRFMNRGSADGGKLCKPCLQLQ